MNWRRSATRSRSEWVLAFARSSICRFTSGSDPAAPERNAERYPSMAASGARSSWATMVTNCDFIWSISLRPVMSRSTLTTPRSRPFSSRTTDRFTISVRGSGSAQLDLLRLHGIPGGMRGISLVDNLHQPFMGDDISHCPARLQTPVQVEHLRRPRDSTTRAASRD